MGLSRVNNVSTTITSGTDTSPVLNAWNTYGGSSGIIIHSPSGLSETVNIEVSPDGINWFTLVNESTLVDEVVPAAGKARFYERLVIAKAFRFKSTTNVGADRIFQITFQAIYS